MRATALALAALLIAGAAAAKDRPNPVLDQLAATPVTCENHDDCEVKWSKALSWVLEHADYKVQLQTDSLIQTYGPLQYPHGTAFLVTKKPLGGGRYEIELRGDCVSTPFCGEPLRDRKASFVREVMALD